MKRPEPYRILIAGGGTGGHVFPAIAIADALSARNRSTEILFAGARGKMEMTKVPQAGYKIEGLWISGFQRKKLLKNLLIPVKVLASLLQARRIIRRFSPHAVVGVGGYASGPVLYAASLMGIPTLIQEQNSFAGATNRILAKRAAKICVAYKGMEKYFPPSKIVLTGNPVRKDIRHSRVSREEALAHFRLQPSRKTLLAVGGSLGARTINLAVQGMLKDLVDSGTQLIWQTGASYCPEALKAAARYTEQVRVFDFIKEMDKAYAAADVVVSRAGALAISELCVTGKPSVLVPSPNVAEDHQTKNAQALAGAALMVSDRDAAAGLKECVMSLVRDENRLRELGRNIGRLALPDADIHIAEEVFKLAAKEG